MLDKRVPCQRAVSIVTLIIVTICRSLEKISHVHIFFVLKKKSPEKHFILMKHAESEATGFKGTEKKNAACEVEA